MVIFECWLLFPSSHSPLASKLIASTSAIVLICLVFAKYDNSNIDCLIRAHQRHISKRQNNVFHVCFFPSPLLLD